MSKLTVSDRKIKANRQNALKSTGPVSDAGKARSSQNARKHGIFCHDLILPGEDPNFFEWLTRGMLRYLNPRNAMELQFVEQIVANEWRIRRVRAEETRVSQQPNEAPSGKRDLSKQDYLERLRRYEHRLRNSVFRCLKEIRQLRRESPTHPSEVTAWVLNDNRTVENVEFEPTDSVSDDEAGICGLDMEAAEVPDLRPGPAGAIEMAIASVIEGIKRPATECLTP